MTRGRFIVFEGIDRVGKSTQVALAHQHLPRSIFLSFPDRTTPSGQMIDAYLTGKIHLDTVEVHSLFAQNRHEASDKIITMLESGIDVLVDRYVWSGIAYAVAQGIEMTQALLLNSGALIPDLIFFLHLAPEKVITRSGYGQEKYEKLQFQTRVHQAFEEIRAHSSYRYVLLDASAPIEHISALVTSVLEKK